MSIRQLLARLDRMPMLKILVPFAAGIALADRFTHCPCGSPQGLSCRRGSRPLLLRSSAALAGMLLTAGFAAARLRAAEPAVPRAYAPPSRSRWRESPPTGAATSRPKRSSRSGGTPRRGAGIRRATGVMLYADSLTPLTAGERFVCRGEVRPFRGGAELPPPDAAAGDSPERSPSPDARCSNGCPDIPEGSTTARRSGWPGFRSEGMREPWCGAMAAGDRSGITPELRTAYSRSGLSHLLAVSGLHTGIVFALVNLALWWLPLLRRGHLVRNVLAAGGRVAVRRGGGSPAERRAGRRHVYGPPETALASASEYVALNALAAAAFGMLLWQPAWLGDIAFRLSFLAVAGILAWGVPLCRRCRTRCRAANAAIDAYLIGLAAAVATTPLVSHTFGTVPLAGLLVNPAAIALATAVVFGGALWMLLPAGPLAPAFALVTGTAAEGSTRWPASRPRCREARPNMRSEDADRDPLPPLRARHPRGMERGTEKSVHLPT